LDRRIISPAVLAAIISCFALSWVREAQSAYEPAGVLRDYVDLTDALPRGEPTLAHRDNSSYWQAIATTLCASASRGGRIHVPAPRTADFYIAHDILNTCGNSWEGDGVSGVGSRNQTLTQAIQLGGTSVDYSAATTYFMAWQVPNFPHFASGNHINGGGIRGFSLRDGTSNAYALISQGTQDWHASEVVINGAYNGVQVFGAEFPVMSHISMYGTRFHNYEWLGDLSGQTQGGQNCTTTHAVTSSGTTISWPGSNLSANTYLWFTGSLPGGLASNYGYWVLASGLTANTFQVSLTPGGSAVTAGTGSGFNAVSAPGGADCSTRTDAPWGDYLNNIDNAQTNTVFTITGFVATSTLSHTTAEGPYFGMLVTCPAGGDPAMFSCPQFGRFDDIQIEFFKNTGVVVQDMVNVYFNHLYSVGDGSTGHVTAATKASDGTGGSNGSGVYAVSGGTGTAATLNVTWLSGVLTVNSVASTGSYGSLPAVPAAISYVSGTATGWTGATVNLTTTNGTNNAFAFYNQNYNSPVVPVGVVQITNSQLFAVSNDCAYFGGNGLGIYNVEVSHTRINGCNISNGGYSGIDFVGPTTQTTIDHNVIGIVDNYGGTSLLGRAVALSSTTTKADVSDNDFGSIDTSVAPVANPAAVSANNHVHDNSGPGGPPAPGSCGTSPALVSGRDEAFVATVGSGGPSSCAFNFGSKMSSAPSCSVANSPGAAVVTSVSSSNSAVTWTGAAMSGSYSVICRQP
jgi:hypothetical protein